MRYLVWIAILAVVLSFTTVGYRHNASDDDALSTECTINDTISVPKLSDEDIDEIIRMADSINMYGVKEGVKRFHKDSVNISDEDSQLVVDMLHEVIDEAGIYKTIYFPFFLYFSLRIPRKLLILHRHHLNNVFT